MLFNNTASIAEVAYLLRNDMTGQLIYAKLKSMALSLFF
jgi:hypothetical protein